MLTRSWCPPLLGRPRSRSVTSGKGRWPSKSDVSLHETSVVGKLPSLQARLMPKALYRVFGVPTAHWALVFALLLSGSCAARPALARIQCAACARRAPDQAFLGR